MIILIFLTKISWKGCDYFSFFRKLGARKFEKGGQTKIDQVWLWQEEKRGAFFPTQCRKTIDKNVLFFHNTKNIWLKVFFSLVSTFTRKKRQQNTFSHQHSSVENRYYSLLDLEDLILESYMPTTRVSNFVVYLWFSNQNKTRISICSITSKV